MFNFRKIALSFHGKVVSLADRELTNRPYYWSFVDRIGGEPETMTYLFVTDKNKYDAAEELKKMKSA